MGLFSKVFGFVEDIFSAIGDVFSWMLGIPDEDEYEGQLLNKSSNVANIPVVYGTRLVGGTRAFVSTGGNRKNEYLYMVLAVSEGEIDQFKKIYFNDKLVTGSAVSGKPYKKVTSGDYKNIIWYQTFNGTDSQQACTTLFNDIGGGGSIFDALFGAQGPDDFWSVDHRLRGVAYIAVVVKYHQDKGMTSIPEIRCEVKGRRVYNPDTGVTEWTDNPALCLRDYLTNTRYGKGLPDSAIDDDAFIAAASFCATPKDSYTNGPQVNVFSLNAIIDTSKTIFKNTQKILTAMRGIMPYTEGKYSILIDKDEESVGTITSDIVTKDISIKSTSKDKKLNQAKVVFVNPYKRWEKDHVIYPAANSAEEAQFLAEDNNQILSKEITLDTVTNFYQARELARVIVLSSRSTSMMVSIICTSEALQYAVGDVIKLENESMGWTDGAEKSFRIMSMQLSVDGQVGLTLQEYDSQIYPWVVSTQEDDQPETTLPNPSFVEPVTNASATAGAQVLTDGTTQYYLDFEWDAPDDALVSEYNVEVTKKVGTVTTNNIETITTRANKARYIVTDTDAEYGFVVKAVNGASAVSDGFTVTPVATVADTTAPGDITGLSATGGLQSISLSWTNPTDADFDLVNIKVSDDDVEPAEIYAQVRSDSYTYEVGNYSTTKYFWVAPVDRTGNVGSYTGSATAQTGAIAIGDIPSVAGLFRIALDNDDAPTDTEFKNAIGRDPINNDSVIVNNEFAFSYNGTTWTAVTELIDGSLLVSDSVTASQIDVSGLITTGELAVTGDLPTAVSELTNDSNFIDGVSWTEISGTKPNVSIFGDAIVQSDVDSSINNVVISGRNLISVISMDGVPTDGVYGGKKYARKLARNNANYRIDNWDGLSNDRQAGKYSLSFWAKVNDSADNPVTSDLNLQVDIGDQNSTNYSINSDWRYYTLENVQVDNYLDSPYFGFVDMFVNGNVIFYASNVKLEYGTKITDWTPAPEDVETPSWYSVTGAVNTNAPANSTYLAVANRNPVQGDVVLITDTSGNSKNYQYDGNAWQAITALIRGDLLVSDSVTANEINTNTVLTESLLANTANITGDLTVTSGKITVQDTDTVINLDPDAQYPFRISQGTEDVVRLGSSTADPFIKGAFIRGMPVGSINEADLSTFVRNVVGVTSEEKTETETLTRLETGGNLTYLETDTITTGLTTVLTLESVAGTQSWLYEYADAGDWENGDFALFNYTLQGYNGSDWENVPLWVNRPIFASGYRISGALIGWSISESYSVTIENNTFTHFRMVVGNMPEEFGGGLHATSTGINCDFKLTSVTGSQVNSDNYVNSFSINDTSGVITVGRTGSLGNLTADISTYVGNQVSSLVDSAPATLDTLNELAAALGDDANFAQTTATALGTKWTQDNTKISNWDDAYEQQHSWEWRWQRWAGLRSPSADTTDAWQTYYETYFTKRTEAVDTTYPLQDSGYINTIDNVDSTGGFGGSTYGNMFGNLSTYHCLIYTNIYVDKEFTVNVTNFSGDDPHAIFVDGKFVHGRIPCCSDTAYNYTFTQGWHRIDLIYSEGGGGDWIRMGWNPKDYLANISDMVAHRGSENPVYLSDKINAVNNSSNWDTAYGWGDHSTQGYLTSFDITTQTDSKYLRSDADDTTSGNVTFSGSNWYLMSLGARGASSGAYGIGNRSNDAYRQLTFHVPNVAAYSSTGTVPSFGWYSNGSVELMNLKSDSGDLTIKGDFTTGSGGDISTGAYANITSYGNVKATNGVFQVGNTTVIDNARNLTNISDTQSHTKVHKYLGSTGDYIQYVVPLIQLNHAVASTESVFIGKLVAWRGNGLYAPPVIYINCQRKHNTTNYELTYRTEGHTTGFTPVTFVYNGNTYLGVRQSVSSAQTYGGFFVDGYTKGTVPTLEKIAYYDNRGTVLNAEINNSISTSVTSTGSYKFGSSVSVEGTLSAQGYNDANWNAAYTYSQVGHLPLAGGSLSGNLTVGSNNSASSLVVNDIDGAKYQIRTGGYDLKFEKHDADADAYATALELRGVNANDGAPTVYVNNRLDVNGNIKFDGTATTTNQSRGIEWTGFDKEGTTDFSDNAYIKHVTNVGGLSGSVLEIKSMNDASDGVAFTTNSNTGVRINGNTVFNDAYHPNADKWTTARTITLGGDLTGSVSIDGSSDVTLSGQVVNDSHTHDGRYFTEAESDGRYLNRSSAIESNLDTKYDADLFGFSTSTTGRPENYGQGISIVSSGNTHNNSNNWITQLAFGTSANSAYFRTKVNASGWNAWRTIWHSGNFATGSDTRNFGSLQINGTTVIDSSRNIRSVPTASIGTALSGNFPDLTSTLDVSSVTAQANFSSNALPYGTDRAQLVLESRHSATKDSLLGFSAPLIDLRANNSSSQWSVAQIIGTVDPESGGNHQGGLVFSTSGGGTSNPAGRRNQGASPTARMLIGATGNVSILTGDLKIGTTTVIDSSRNLVNIGRIDTSSSTSGGVRVHTNSGLTASNNYFNIFTSQTGGWSFNANGTGADSSQVAKISLTGGITATDKCFIDGGHSTARLQIRYNHSTDAGKGYLTLWASEPGITYDNCGIGGNINSSGQYYGRENNGSAYGAYLRFDINNGESQFWSTTGNAGTAGGKGTQQAVIKPTGKISTRTGYEVGATTVIDASRNLTNISTISTTGDVEIGTYSTTGSGVLRLNGSTANKQSILQTTNGNLHIDSNAGQGIYLNYFSSTGFVMIMQNKGKVDSAGNATFNGNVTAYGSASDIRLKYDVKNIDNALNKVLSLDGINFKYKKDDSESTGVIAQQVQEVLPQAVYETSDIGSDEKHLAVRYGNMVGLLIEAIKEQQSQIDELKSKLEK